MSVGYIISCRCEQLERGGWRARAGHVEVRATRVLLRRMRALFEAAQPRFERLAHIGCLSWGWGTGMEARKLRFDCCFPQHVVVLGAAREVALTRKRMRRGELKLPLPYYSTPLLSRTPRSRPGVTPTAE